MRAVAIPARARPVGVSLLFAWLLVAMITTSPPAKAAPEPGGLSLSDVQVTATGVTAILTTRTASGARIDPTSVKATLGGVGAGVAVEPIVAGRRVTTLLIDTSGSMGAAGMATVVRAADAFLSSVPADVYVGVVAFSSAPKVITAPTRNRAKVRTAIAGLRSKGETTLYDGIAAALAQLGTSGDRSFILLSDGGDTRSRQTLAQTLAALSTFGVRAQVVGFKTDESQGSVLSGLAKAGHGTVVAAGDSAAVSAAFKVAAQTLGSQIRVVITAPPSVNGLQPLAVTATADGKALQSMTSVNLAVSSPLVPVATAEPTEAPAPAAVVPVLATTGPLGLAWLIWFALLTVFLGVTGAVIAGVSPTYVPRRQRRLNSIEAYVSGDSLAAVERTTPTVASISKSLVGLGDKVMDSRDSTPRTQQLLERADLALRPGEWAVLRVVAVVIGMAGGMLLMPGGGISSLVGVALGTIVGFLAPVLFLKFAASRRAKKFDSQLPDVLTLVASSLSTGFSLLQALDAVATDAPEPSAKEFSRALAETRIGANIDDSLAHLADRMDSVNMRWTGMAINIQRQVGGNLAETLRTTAATLRDREALSRHVKALSAEGKLSAYILFGLPIGIFLYMLGVNRAYVELLWTTTIGLGMVAAGLVQLAVGVLWMRKVVVVEV